MEAKYRIGGILCLVLAVVIAWLAIWQPLQQASAGADVVKWMPRISVLVALCAVFGLYFLATGNRYPYRNEAQQTLTPVGWVLLVIVAIASFATFFGVDMTLRSMGYQ